jgi:ribosomal protein S18 acetylase RimI-like enzyme
MWLACQYEYVAFDRQEGLRPPRSPVSRAVAHAQLLSFERKGIQQLMNTVVPSHVPVLIAEHMRAEAGRGQRHRAGPFAVGLDGHSDDPMRNFAVPDSGACPTADQVDALIAFFRQHHRIPRLEYVEASAPGVEQALVAAGFAVERRTPVMISTPDSDLTPREPAGITVREAAGDTDLAEAVAVQHHAYQVPQPPGPRDIARLAGVVRRGGVVSVAVDDISGAVAGTGLVDVTDPDDSVGELAAVGVLAGFRRRGIASALSAHLASTAHARGIGLVFLEAEPEEERIYRRAGFADATTKIWISRPGG